MSKSKGDSVLSIEPFGANCGMNCYFSSKALCQASGCEGVGPGTPLDPKSKTTSSNPLTTEPLDKEVARMQDLANIKIDKDD